MPHFFVALLLSHFCGYSHALRFLNFVKFIEITKFASHISRRGLVIHDMRANAGGCSDFRSENIY